MKCYGLWYGGGSYAAPTMEDLEEYGSLKEAIWVFQYRAENVDGRTPCVDTPEMTLYAEKKDAGGPDYWRFLELGPRGGVRVSR